MPCDGIRRSERARERRVKIEFNEKRAFLHWFVCLSGTSLCKTVLLDLKWLH